MYQAEHQAYRQSVGNTLEDKPVILIKLFDAAIMSLGHARRGILEQSPKIRGENISHAMRIIEELNCALDRENGGQLVSQLSDLYRFVMNRLTEASLHNDLKALDDARGILTTLKEGFDMAVQQQKSAPPVPTYAEAGAQNERGLRFAV